MKQRCPNEKCREDVRYPIFFRSVRKEYRIDEYGDDIPGDVMGMEENEDYCGICGEELVDDDEEE